MSVVLYVWAGAINYINMCKVSEYTWHICLWALFLWKLVCRWCIRYVGGTDESVCIFDFFPTPCPLNLIKCGWSADRRESDKKVTLTRKRPAQMWTMNDTISEWKAFAASLFSCFNYIVLGHIFYQGANLLRWILFRINVTLGGE